MILIYFIDLIYLRQSLKYLPLETAYQCANNAQSGTKNIYK